jgi:hypothetical protein
MVIRVPFESLPEEVRSAIERGDCVEFDRDGNVVARMEGEKPSWEERRARWAERARSEPPVDYDEFLADLEQIREEMNRPAEARYWE